MLIGPPEKVLTEKFNIVVGDTTPKAKSLAYCILLQYFEAGQQRLAQRDERLNSLFALDKLIELSRLQSEHFGRRASLYLQNCYKNQLDGRGQILSLEMILYINLSIPSLVFSNELLQSGPIENHRRSRGQQQQPETIFNYIIKNMNNKTKVLKKLEALVKITEQGFDLSAEESQRSASIESMKYLINIAKVFVSSDYRTFVMQYLNRCIQWQRDSQSPFKKFIEGNRAF